MDGDTTITISILVALLGGGIGVASFIGNLIRNKTNETRKQDTTTAQITTQNARIETKLDSISDNVSTIKADMQNLSKTVIEHGERLAVVEHALEQYLKSL